MGFRARSLSDVRVATNEKLRIELGSIKWRPIFHKFWGKKSIFKIRVKNMVFLEIFQMEIKCSERYKGCAILRIKLRKVRQKQNNKNSKT